MEPLRGRRKNHRLYPGAKHRADLALTRQQEAKERQTAYNNLTVQQKLDRLPAGGANRQRARLTAALQNRQERKETIDKSIAEARKSGVYEAVEHQTSELDIWKDKPEQDLANRNYMKGIKKDENQ